MTRFSNGQRIEITNKENPDFGKVGTVVRVRMSDDGAWVKLTQEPAYPNFPVGDSRHNDVLLYPDEAEARP